MKSSSREGDSKLLGDQRKRQARTAGRDARAERGLSAVTATARNKDDLKSTASLCGSES